MNQDEVLAGSGSLAYSDHARRAIAERLISTDWIERIVSEPELRTDDPNDIELERFYARVPEREGRVLRVVVNTQVEPWRVVSVFFDRRMRRRL